jgi:NTE family protein
MDTRLQAAPTPETVRTYPITLALEGGGALGSFTWGVIERLLDVPQLRIHVVSGTSAGAMNGAMLVQGLVNGGPPAAKDLLETFWHRVAIAAGSLPGPSIRWLQVVAGTMAPVLEAVRTAGSALNPGVSAFAINPLRGILHELLHPPRFGEPGAPELIVAATRVRTGEARLFRGAEVSIDALLASACLPQIFPAVEIDGEAYWDGGYSSNPPVRPLIEAGAPTDVLIVRTAPPERLGLPTRPAAVKERLDEITFGTALRAELHSLALAQSSLAGVSGLPPTLARLRDARLHMIGPEEEDEAAAVGALHPTWSVLSEQRRRGFAAADRWVAEHLSSVGRHSTLDTGLFAGPNAGAGHAPAPIHHLREGSFRAT